MHLLKYVVETNNFYYVLISAIDNEHEFKISSNKIRSNGRAIIDYIRLLTFAKTCSGCASLIKINLHLY